MTLVILDIVKTNDIKQFKLFEFDSFFVEFKLKDEDTVRTTRSMTFEETEDFIEFLEVFAIEYEFANIKQI
jgi:hypothetical protein